MKKVILLTAVIFLSSVALVQAEERELHGSVGIAYQSKYIWRGFDVFGDKSAIQPSIDLDLFDTGFGIDVMAHRANSSGYENGERWDYTLYYHNRLFEDESYATNYVLSYVYYNFPDSSSHTRNSTDLQEVNALLSWPNILGIKGLVPSYCIVKLWPSNSDSLGGAASGFAHIFMLDYGLNVGKLMESMKEQILNLHTELVYNDGVDPRGIGVDHDWSNVVFGISTDFDLSDNLVFTPGVYHQVTMDKSVNEDKDETWASLNIKYKF